VGRLPKVHPCGVLLASDIPHGPECSSSGRTSSEWSDPIRRSIDFLPVVLGNVMFLRDDPTSFVLVPVWICQALAHFLQRPHFNS